MLVKIKLVGHGLITDVLTSDLWVWPGVGKHKGKDFAVTGTWGQTEKPILGCDRSCQYEDHRYGNRGCTYGQ